MTIAYYESYFEYMMYMILYYAQMYMFTPQD